MKIVTVFANLYLVYNVVYVENKKKITKINNSDEFMENAQSKLGFLNCESLEQLKFFMIYIRAIIYDYIVFGIKVRGKCEWYEHGEKSKKCECKIDKDVQICGVQN